MGWVAVLYALAGTGRTDWLGRPLVGLNFERQRYEADFRFSLVRFRENTEGVALYRGEPDEFRGFRERFEDVVGNWWGIMRRQKRMAYFTQGYGLGAWIVPSLVAAPSSRSRMRSAPSSSHTRRSRPGAPWSSGWPASSARSSMCADGRPMEASGAPRAAPRT